MVCGAKQKEGHLMTKSCLPVYLLLLAGCLAATALGADPIVVAGDVFALGKHAFPVKVEMVGVEITADSISDSNTDLEGADLNGWHYGMSQSTQVKLIFQAPIVDQAGDDLYFGEGRMMETLPVSGNRHALEFSFDGITWHRRNHDDFTRASTYWYLPRTTVNGYYQLYKSTIDLADYGITEPVTEVFVRGVEYLNFVLAGNLNSGVEVDLYKPLVTLFGQAGSYAQNNQTHYTGWYMATIFAHDAAGVQKTVLWQRVKGDPTWTRVDVDKSVSGTIGGTFGGHYRLAFDYSGYSVGTRLDFKNVIIDKSGKSQVIVKKTRVLANGNLKFLN